MVYVNIDQKWTKMTPNKVIFVISPGAGTRYNRLAYVELEKQYTVLYFTKSGGQYDKYPPNWYDNKKVDTSGFHLGGIASLVKDYMLKNKIIPCCFICGSRGSQVTIGKIWESYWRGTTIMINAGSLTSSTNIPVQVEPIFITMEHDYFKSVNTLAKVKKLFHILASNGHKGAYQYHLINHSHMPNLNTNLVELLLNLVKKHVYHHNKDGYFIDNASEIYSTLITLPIN